MTLSTSRALPSSSNSGFSTPACPTSASMAVPPRAGFGAVATGTQLTSATAISVVAPARNLLAMSLHPDIGHRADEERGHQHPRGPVNLALEAATRAVPTAESVTTAAADGSPEPAGFRCLDQYAGHEQNGENHFDDDECFCDVNHLCLLVALRDRFPVEGIEPGGDVVGSPVLVLQIVGVLPYVNAQDRSVTFHVRTVLVRVRLDRQLAAAVTKEPRPAAAELADGRLLQLLLERVVAAEGARDRVAQPAGWGAATSRAHDRPEDRVVGVAACVVAEDVADVLRH